MVAKTLDSLKKDRYVWREFAIFVKKKGHLDIWKFVHDPPNASDRDIHRDYFALPARIKLGLPDMIHFKVQDAVEKIQAEGRSKSDEEKTIRIVCQKAVPAAVKNRRKFLESLIPEFEREQNNPLDPRRLMLSGFEGVKNNMQMKRIETMINSIKSGNKSKAKKTFDEIVKNEPKDSLLGRQGYENTVKEMKRNKILPS